ncbi:HupK protein [Cereibacter sphaeroides]|uniref:HupK protein n=1 Tax=Cereibacter sphaeroides TaxID=1063 RepID=UPI001F35E1D1|nr:HupK protein [Cereibacter sphaeroides]MCE6950201.1 HupK protein [Cereibacter sphaeroides]
MTGALTIRPGPEGWRLDPAPALPVEALMLGRSPEAAAELLPRIFNLCPVAQATAVRLALDLPLPAGPDLSAEVAREHRLKLGLLWPKLLGLSTHDLPGLPAPAALEDWVRRHPLFATLLRLFPAGVATADLPAVRPDTAMTASACDNSPAARRQDHPLLVAAGGLWGKGPLWRALGRLVDLSLPLPAPIRLEDATAVVPAARGSYAVRARAESGLVRAFARTTPTDHLLAPGGALARSLATLPADAGNLAPLVVAILDPCVPVQFAEVAHA